MLRLPQFQEAINDIKSDYKSILLSFPISL